ncbi:alpha/beta-hydrolase [Glonium stellatum]|uniref:Alpha/beta-hydrolase n=1 Tax=Glonium stellatum TaxID=574774 RepID=A0A8E2JWX8_9PEZI|nr:alpha/beta-hydrolase [Glonium stellatum]
MDEYTGENTISNDSNAKLSGSSATTLPIRDISTNDTTSFPYIFEQNVDIPLKTYETGLIRVNVYRPHSSDTGSKFPVLATYGPYGKDVWYEKFRKPSFDEVNPEHKSLHSAWETPDPKWWTTNGYAIVRADERGIGQSPGLMDTMSRGTSEAFKDVVEWAAEQPWSNGKVGLLGISYYAGTQWRVAARRPKGLAAIIPWEGMSDYYRDRCRHGGILSDKFIQFWWNAQVVVNQYGRPRRPGSALPETIEGHLGKEQLKANLRDQTVDNEANKFMDDEYYATRDYRIEDIEVPLLSVANWGGILLHLRGNVEGFTRASSKLKYLRFITGRHDLPFYYDEEALLQKSFLDAFLKGEDSVGWATPGKVPTVSVVLREGDVGFNDAEKEKAYPRREEASWPLPDTQYEKYYLLPDKSFTSSESPESLQMKSIVRFTTAPFSTRTEFTGYVTAHLNVRIPPQDPAPSDIDLFLTIRHISPTGNEVFYTGTAGDPVPVTKGWLRVSLRATDPKHPLHRPYLPYRHYRSIDVQEVKVSEIYAVDVEIWPTNVVVSEGGKLIFEISGADTQGSGIFAHESEKDRPEKVFKGTNEIVFGVGEGNYVVLPRVPKRD